MGKQTLVYVLALLAGLGAVMISWFAIIFPYSVDSASYLDQARSFIERGVFEITPYAPGELDVISVPDNLFPPGFPLLIVFCSLISQLPVEVIAPYLSLAALFLLPLAIVFCFQRVIGVYPALWIGILFAFTPTAVKVGYIAYSDTLSLLLVIFSIKLLLFADNKASSWFFLGLLTGFSYLLRNANLALLMSIFLFLLWEMRIERESCKQKIKNALIWASGNALLIIPWLLRNFLVFGKFQPYSMPPSSVGLIENIHDYIKAQLDTLLALNKLDELIVNSTSGIWVLIVIFSFLLYQVIFTWHQWRRIEQQTFFISITYIALGAAMVIAARTKYQWGVHISPRHVIGFLCFIFVALFIIFKNSTLKIIAPYLFGLSASGLLLVRFYALPELYQYDQFQQTVRGAAHKIVNNPDVICLNLNGRYAVSNYAFVYRVLCAAPVRHVFPSFEHNKFLEESLKSWADLGAKRGIVVSIFPYKDDKLSDLPLKKEELNKLDSEGWQVERNDKENLIISHKSSSLKK